MVDRAGTHSPQASRVLGRLRRFPWAPFRPDVCSRRIRRPRLRLELGLELFPRPLGPRLLRMASSIRVLPMLPE